MTAYNLKPGSGDPFILGNVEDVVKACISFYNGLLKKADETPEVYERRNQLSRWIRKFHRECGTLTSCVEDKIERLEGNSCLVLMTAHQPNLFAYSGVLRKATLNYVLASELSDRLGIPVVNFFGVADQDFTDDRWVESALLPDVERRKGELELRFSMPECMMLNKVSKPSKQVLDNWRSKIERWFNKKLKSVGRFCRSFGLEFSSSGSMVLKNFEDLWRIVEDAQKRVETYSDFNALVMSKIINEVWGYDTLFSRFSECQQIFEPEFCFLLSHFEKYSRYLKEVITAHKEREGGVSQHEYETIPFWYHCNCGGKVRLTIVDYDKSFGGRGHCLRCRKEYKIGFDSRREPDISGILPRISARSLSVPLIFFDSLKVCCYVGGVGGRRYLEQAKYVGEQLGKIFPPMILWRPRDVYLGLGQLEALLYYRSFSESFDLSEYSDVEAGLKDRISRIEDEVEKLELEKESIVGNAKMKPESKKEKIKAISIKQTKIRKKSDFSVIVRELELLKNTKTVMQLYPCIIDHAINVGLRSVSDQWIAFLKTGGNLSSNVSLRTDFDDVLPLEDSLHLIASEVQN